MTSCSWAGAALRPLGMLLLVGGCTTAIYSGPRRPANEVATLKPSDTMIEEIDGMRLQAPSGEFEVLPGQHSLLVFVYAERSAPYVHRLFFSQYPQRVCFNAKPGRTYLVSPKELGNGQWEPQIIDQTTLYWVSTRRPQPGASDCLVP